MNNYVDPLSIIERNDLVCPSCGSGLVEIVEQIAPKGEEEATKDTFVGMLGGASLLGAAGALLGPGGVLLGGLAGSAIGGAYGHDQATSHHLGIRCQSCGHSWKESVKPQ